MNKEEALTGFLKGLRIAINNSLAYSRAHPYFLKNAQDFKEKIDETFNFLNPIKVNVATEALFLDGKEWKKAAYFVELAHILHQRKIKSIEFQPGLSAAEVADFLSLLALQPKEIIRNGGLSRLLGNAKSQHIRVENLDYAQLLGGQGEEAKDIWVYLFKEAVEKRDNRRINEFAGDFSKGLHYLNVKEIIEDDQLRQLLAHFLSHLKKEEKEKFFKCAQELSSFIVNSASQVSSDKADKLKEIFGGLESGDFTDILLSQLSGESSFNALNLELFSRLAGEKNAGQIASSLVSKVESRPDLKNNPVFLKQIRDLLSSPGKENASPVYRSALSALLKDISTAASLFFDCHALRVNYRMVILNLFVQEANPDELNLLLKRLDKGWEQVAQDKDYGFLRNLLDTLKQKRGGLPPDAAENIARQISRIVEADIWDGALPEDLIQLAASLEKSYSAADFYLNKLFQEKKLSLCGLKLFLGFFPAQLDTFYGLLKQRHADLEFLSQIIKISGQIDLPVSLAVLKEIYSFGNELMKTEVLRAMRACSEFDPEFIFPILREKSHSLKKEALLVLLRDSAAKPKAIEMLLGMRSPWGIKNQLLLENILVIEELGVREARDDLILFSKRRFFWNRQLRNKALAVLENWK